MALTPSTGAASCSTDTHTQALAPLWRSVTHDLQHNPVQLVLKNVWGLKKKKKKSPSCDFKFSRASSHLRTTLSEGGCGAMLFRMNWYTSVSLSSVLMTRLSSRSSSQRSCSRMIRCKTSSGPAGTSTQTFHCRSDQPSCTCNTTARQRGGALTHFEDCFKANKSRKLYLCNI